MKVLYLSSHAILEWDELSLLTELEGLDIEVFSLGAYMNPAQKGDFSRSVIPKGVFYPQLYTVAMQCDKDRIHPELVDWADVILSMHNSKLPGDTSEQPWLHNNWQLFKDKKKQVIWRSIGQSTSPIEKELKKYVKEGLKIVRYSYKERNIPDYAGEDAMIRFVKDPNEYEPWQGDKKQVITFAQSFMKRGNHLGYSVFDKATGGFQRKVFGKENEDLGVENGGFVTYAEQKQHLKENRVFFYTGTQPASYTLSLIEAMIAGIPVIAIGKKLWDTGFYNQDTYEVPDIITNGVNGYVSDDIQELRNYIQLLMDDHDLARRIGEAGRKTAIDLFGKEKISGQWKDFLSKI